MRKVLIQLIGGQTLPNLISILMVKPDCVVNIYTKESIKQHEIIKNWCARYGEKHGVCPQFVETETIGDSLGKVAEGIGRIIQLEVDKVREAPDTMLILNMTGGTKLMSFAAVTSAATYSQILKAENLYPIPSFYINPIRHEIEFLSFSALRHEVMARDINDVRLSVAELIAVQGDVELVSHVAGWETVYPLAKKLRDFAVSGIYFKFEEVKNDNFVEKSQAPFSSLLTNKHEEKLEKARSTMKNLAAKIADKPEFVRALELCGVVARDDDFYLSAQLQQIVNAQSRSKKKNTAALHRMQGALNFFEGGWWEVIVAHAYQVENPQAEVLWSAVTAHRDDHEHGVETDVIATPDGRMLCCISCKRGVQEKVVQHLEQHSTRTAMLSGVIHKCIIAVYTQRGVEQLTPLASALKMTMWDARRVHCIETGKEYVQNIKPASDAAPVEEVSKAAPVESPAEKEVDEEPMPAVLPFLTRLKLAVDYVLTGKGM